MGGKWTVGKRLGAGGMGVVYAAEHAQLGRRVAVEFLLSQGPGGSQQMERFLREARAAGVTDHEGIARVLDFETLDDGTPHIVMELLEGEPLEDRMQRRGELTLADGVAILLDMPDTLAFVHGRGVIHRDIKPDNIFLVPDRRGGVRTKLLGFGVAFAGDAVGDPERLTAAGALLGTPAYLSPEQASGEPNVGPAADLWATGVVLFRMATGALPVRGSSFLELVANPVLTGPADPRTPPPGPAEVPPGRAGPRAGAGSGAALPDGGRAGRGATCGRPGHRGRAAAATREAGARPRGGDADREAGALRGPRGARRAHGARRGARRGATGEATGSATEGATPPAPARTP